MRKASFGGTTRLVSSIGLGLAALGRPGYITIGHHDDLASYAAADMQAQAHAVLDAAWDAGVRYFDAARSYGRAEEFLGSWLRLHEIPAEQVLIDSKWGYRYTAQWQTVASVHEVKEHSLDVFRRQFEESRQALGAYLGVYQVHSATLDSGLLGNVPLLRALATLKESGVLVGLSVTGPRQCDTINAALEITIDGAALFDSVQATWNVLERGAESALRAAHTAGRAVILKEVLANGRLVRGDRNFSFRKQWSRLSEQASRLGTSVDALCIAAACAQSWVSVALSGATTVSQICSNVRAAEVAWDDEANLALAEIAEDSAEYWLTRSRLPWN